MSGRWKVRRLHTAWQWRWHAWDPTCDEDVCDCCRHFDTWREAMDYADREGRR